MFLGLTACVYSWNTGGGFERGSDLNMGKNKITGDSSTGIYFDPDNDGTVEITMTPEGGISASSMTITNYYADNVNVTYGISAATGVFSGAISATTLNTGQGANELYAMNQNVRTTDSVTHLNVTGTNGLNTTYGISAATGVFSGKLTSATTIQSVDGIFTTVYGGSIQLQKTSGDPFIYLKNEDGDINAQITSPTTNEIAFKNQDNTTYSDIYSRKVVVSTAMASSASGLWLTDDGGNGIFVKDGGWIGIGNTNPTSILSIGNGVTTGAKNISMANPSAVDNPLSLTMARAGSYLAFVGISGNGMGFGTPGTGFTTDSGLEDRSTMFINKSLKVGIGITNPSQKLEVVGIVKSSGVYARGADGLKLYDDGNNGIFIEDGGKVGIGTTDPAGLLSLGSSIGNTKLAIYDNGSAFFGLGIQSYQFRLHLSGSDSRFSFLSAPAGSELLTIKGTGNVGIGTTNPSQKLEVVGVVKSSGVYARGADGLKLYDDGNNGIFIQDGGNVGIGTTDPICHIEEISPGTGNRDMLALSPIGYYLELSRNDSSIGANDLLGSIGFDGTEGSLSTSGQSVQLQAYAEGAYGTTNKGAYFVVRTKDQTIDYEDPPVERFRIDSYGNIGISSATPTAKLEIAGDLKVSGITHNTYVFAGSSITATTSITTDVFTTLANTFTEVIDGESEWTILGSSATYTGTNDRVIKVFAHGCGDASAATVASFALFQNGVKCDYCEEHYDIANNVHQAIGIQGIFSISTNDIISLQVTTDDGDNINMDHVNISIIQVN